MEINFRNLNMCLCKWRKKVKRGQRANQGWRVCTEQKEQSVTIFMCFNQIEFVHRRECQSAGRCYFQNSIFQESATLSRIAVVVVSMAHFFFMLDMYLVFPFSSCSLFMSPEFFLSFFLFRSFHLACSPCLFVDRESYCSSTNHISYHATTNRFTKRK